MWWILACGGHSSIRVDESDPSFPGGVHLVHGPEALAGDPGSAVVLGPVDCGYWVIGPGDVDGDSVPDVVVGCDQDQGTLRYLSGAALSDGLRTEFATVRLRELTYGGGPVAVGDVDDDGLGDVGIEVRYGAMDTPLWDWGLVVPGSEADGELQAEDVAWHLLGDGSWYPGIAASPAGDYDGDGTLDLVVSGFPSEGGGPGVPVARAWVVSGAALVATSPGGRIDAGSAPLADLSGPLDPGGISSAAALGDLDGDGRDDLGVVTGSAAPAAPELRIVPGGTASADLARLVRLTAFAARREASVEAAPLGDLDGDGRGELAVRLRSFGSSEDQEDGVAVVPGAAIPPGGTLRLEPFLLTRTDVAEIEPCDLDGDGRPELVTQTGIWSGADLLVPGAPPVADGFPGRLACVGDLDGDGTEDLAWGDPGLD